MPRKKQPTAPVTETPPRPESEKKWAEPYRPLFSRPDAGFEMGENKLANQMVFYFAHDPGDQVKLQLKHYGYCYDTKQKNWTVNATPLAREIAHRLAEKFAGEQVMLR